MNKEEEFIKKMHNEFLNLVKQMGEQRAESAYEHLKISADNVFHPAALENREIFKNFLDQLILDGSSIKGKENLSKFYENFKAGKSSLILAEHKSNFDVPIFYAMMYDQEELFKKIFEDIVFIAGRKLNEDTVFVKLMAEQFNRVIVVPKSEVSDEDEEDSQKAMQINLATQRFIRSNRSNYIFLVYPTGTRSKAWDRSTYKGIREAFNYLKNFDQFILMSVNGNCMVPAQTQMSKEVPRADKIEIVFSEVYNSKEWVKEQKAQFSEASEKDDFKQYSIDKIMDLIYTQKGIMPWDEK